MKYDIRNVQSKQMEILMELNRVCSICDINYYLAAGTCLGAVRHKGFIPWDDDIDVFMHYNDLELLIENKNLFEEKYFLQCPQTDPDVNTVHARLRDSSTTCIMKEDVHRNMNMGMFIDIYVLYPYPDKKITAQKIIFDSHIHRILQIGDGPKNHGKIVSLAGKAICKIYGSRADAKKEKIYNEYKKNGGKKYYSIYFGEDISMFWSRVYPQEWFGEPSMCEFEGQMFPCPSDPHEYCKFRYGDDYMKLPPVELRKTTHDFVIIDTDRPYYLYE